MAHITGTARVTVSVRRSSASAEQIRRAATINDIGGILELIRPLEQQGILVRRLVNNWRWETITYHYSQRDNMTIACAAPSL